jgi:hypothetical protein
MSNNINNNQLFLKFFGPLGTMSTADILVLITLCRGRTTFPKSRDSHMAEVINLFTHFQGEYAGFHYELFQSSLLQVN